METVSRFLQAPTVHFFLFGARGTGKSTWVQKQYPNALQIDLLRPDVLNSYTAHPERIEEVLEGNPEKKIICVDEVQKAPMLLQAIHRLIEKDKSRQFILTGSSARKLKQAGVDLLGGRAIVKTLHPFMAAELGEDFNLQKALKKGLLPIVLDSPTPQEVLQAYRGLYIQQEVKMEGMVRNLGNFARFLEAISFSHASVLNVSNVARECEVERKTVEGYISILEDLLLFFTIPVFRKKAKRKLIKHQKAYFFDAGVFQSIRTQAIGPLDTNEEILGPALEGMVAQHLRAWAGYANSNTQIFFWRTTRGVEVDFVVYGKAGFWALEVKNSTRISSHDLKGLKAFKTDYPESKPILLYRGKEKRKIDGMLCIPCETFLKHLKPGNPLC